MPKLFYTPDVDISDPRFLCKTRTTSDGTTEAALFLGTHETAQSLLLRTPLPLRHASSRFSFQNTKTGTRHYYYVLIDASGQVDFTNQSEDTTDISDHDLSYSSGYSLGSLTPDEAAAEAVAEIQNTQARIRQIYTTKLTPYAPENYLPLINSDLRTEGITSHHGDDTIVPAASSLEYHNIATNASARTRFRTTARSSDWITFLGVAAGCKIRIQLTIVASMIYRPDYSTTAPLVVTPILRLMTLPDDWNNQIPEAGTAAILHEDISLDPIDIPQNEAIGSGSQLTVTREITTTVPASRHLAIAILPTATPLDWCEALCPPKTDTLGTSVKQYVDNTLSLNLSAHITIPETAIGTPTNN